MANIGDIVGNLKLNTSSFKSGVSDITKSLGGLGSAAGKVGVAISSAITVPITIAAKKSIDAARAFESAFAGVQKTVDATPEQFEVIRQGILSMSQELPTTANEIAGVAEAAGQLGIKQEDILGFTRVMVDLGETTNLSAKNGAIILSKFASVLGTTSEDFSRLGSTIVDLGNNFEASESEIAAMAQRMAGAGKQAGLTEANILSIAAALTAVGIRADAGGTSMQKVFIKMNDAVLTSSDKLDVFAKTAGMSADEFARAFREDPADAIASFVEGLGKVQMAGESTTEILGDLGLGEVRVKTALGNIAGAGDKLRHSIEIGNKAWEQNTALTAEAEKRYATTDSALAKLDNALESVKVQMGDTLLPIVKQLAEALLPMVQELGNLVRAFNELPASVKSVAAIFTGTFVVGGPILLGLSAFVAAFGTISAPLLITGAIIGGIIAGALAIVTNWESIKAKAEEIWNAIINYFKTTVEANIQNMHQAWDDLKTKTLNIFNSMMDGIKKAMEPLMTIAENVKGFTDKTVGFFQGMWDTVTRRSIVPDMVDDIAFEFGRLDAVMVNPVMQATQKVIASFEEIRRAQQQALGSNNQASILPLETTTKNIEDNISTWGRLFNSFKFTTRDAMENLAQSLTQVFSSIRTNFVNSIVGMIAGTNTFAQFLQTMWQTILASFLNLVIQMGIKWAITQLAMQTASGNTVVAHQIAEGTKTAITAEQEAARVAMTVLSNKAMLAGTASAVAAMGALGTATMAVMAIVGKAISAIFLAIAVGLTASFYGAALAKTFYVAAAVTAKASAVAAIAGTAGITKATTAALGAIGGLAATPFAEGGAVFGPTLAMIGEAGPEVVAPFSEVERMLGAGEGREIIIMLDGRVIAKSTMKHMPGVVRMQGVPI